MSLPNPTSDGFFCPSCGIHRTTGEKRECPVCDDKTKRGQK